MDIKVKQEGLTKYLSNFANYVRPCDLSPLRVKYVHDP